MIIMNCILCENEEHYENEAQYKCERCHRLVCKNHANFELKGKKNPFHPVCTICVEYRKRWVFTTIPIIVGIILSSVFSQIIFYFAFSLIAGFLYYYFELQKDPRSGFFKHRDKEEE